MRSKIMIDVDDSGNSTVRVTGFVGDLSSADVDVRDKLVKRFLEGGSFCSIGYDEGGASIRSMGPIDVMQEILGLYRSAFKTADCCKEFEQAVYKVCHMLEEVGERSKVFDAMCEAQRIVNG